MTHRGIFVFAALTVLPAVAFAEPAAGGASPAPSRQSSDADAPTASPEVQEQVGMGTEKEAPEEPSAEPDEPPKSPADSREVGEDDDYGHALQVGLRAAVVGAFRMMFRYDKSPYCHKPDLTKDPDEQQAVCGFGAPVATDVALSFGVFDSLEPYVFGRFAFKGESRTNTKAARLWGLGARIYTRSDSRFKVFVEPAIAYETEGGAGNPLWTYNGRFNPDYKKDLVFHIGIGPQYDFARYFGLYANIGVDVGVLRYISGTLFAQAGFQVRVP